MTRLYHSGGAKLKKKYVIKGDNWSAKGPTKNLYILNAEVVLMHGPIISETYSYEGFELGPELSKSKAIN